ncbi:hypothetical protein BDV25DRAFT_157486 [Aspergillus avenaceus]|uniref:Uncharacterized protein n=1 Tax=Aspergillus avenaceus TaxID=36643 RepID=A0A5N6TRP2_ASPAV|nr:hypothetical protein BDV25DRAFT_157486 [Aspergillus avenaceus]
MALGVLCSALFLHRRVEGVGCVSSFMRVVLLFFLPFLTGSRCFQGLFLEVCAITKCFPGYRSKTVCSAARYHPDQGNKTP